MSIFRAMDMAVLVGELVNFCITLKALIIWLVKRRIPNVRLMLERSHITPCMNHVSNQNGIEQHGQVGNSLKSERQFLWKSKFTSVSSIQTSCKQYQRQQQVLHNVQLVQVQPHGKCTQKFTFNITIQDFSYFYFYFIVNDTRISKL